MYPSNEPLMIGPKILMRQTSATVRCCYDEASFYCQNSIFIVHSKQVPLKLLLALLNSKLLGFVYRLKNPQIGKVFAEIKPSVIKEFPIFKTLDCTATALVVCGTITKLVEQMLAAQKQLSSSQSDADKDFYGNKCAGLDRQIDTLVYELYALTPEEIKIVEGVAP